MKEKRCSVCKFKDSKFTPYAKEVDFLYEQDRRIKVFLCTSCSVQLFRKGQKRFLLDHYEILLQDFISCDEPEFIHALYNCVTRHREEVSTPPSLSAF